MARTVQFVTAETERGRLAVEEVMRHSCTEDVASVPAQWAMVRIVDGVPVSFILIDPNRQMGLPRGGLPYAFVCDVATREDRHGEGHFRGIMNEAFSRLDVAGIPPVVLHGPSHLCLRFGFTVLTHHAGVFAEPT